MWVGSSVLDQASSSFSFSSSSSVTFEDENEKEDEDEYLSKDFKQTARALFHQWLQRAGFVLSAPSRGPAEPPPPLARVPGGDF